MKPETRSVRTLDVSLGPGRRTLRLALTRDQNGEPEALILSSGFGGGSTGDPFLRPAWGEGPIQLPASVLPALGEALRALEGGNEG
jgi:hypothetical protein